jgi:hypothetical protein
MITKENRAHRTIFFVIMLSAATEAFAGRPPSTLALQAL